MTMDWTSPGVASPTSRFNINLRFYEVGNKANPSEQVRWDIGTVYEHLFEDALARAEGTVPPLDYERAVRTYMQATLTEVVTTSAYVAVGAALLTDDTLRQAFEQDLYEHVKTVTDRLGLRDEGKRSLRERLFFWKTR